MIDGALEDFMNMAAKETLIVAIIKAIRGSSVRIFVSFKLLPLAIPVAFKRERDAASYCNADGCNIQDLFQIP